jgi:hypothetical protein
LVINRAQVERAQTLSTRDHLELAMWELAEKILNKTPKRKMLHVILNLTKRVSRTWTRRNKTNKSHRISKTMNSLVEQWLEDLKQLA